MGMFDLPSSIDYILSATGRQRLLYVGHSQGTTQFLVMASQLPRYNNKIALATGLAPAAYTGHLRGPITQLTKLSYFGVVRCLCFFIFDELVMTLLIYYLAGKEYRTEVIALFYLSKLYANLKFR